MSKKIADSVGLVEGEKVIYPWKGDSDIECGLSVLTIKEVFIETLSGYKTASENGRKILRISFEETSQSYCREREDIYTKKQILKMLE